LFLDSVDWLIGQIFLFDLPRMPVGPCLKS
jgi:hypothetical protein